ncbi:histidine phosphatase family protein [Zongyangia hominis]|uniref:Histidine phosphatase family protein n=1 Tax=Zongyangia hominis TaxID=2763677 RepID=A0A926EDC9_9FIRM|nr:histidine phosphatase family protein [Zongyangia hominis]MBC8571000.1 histidine phosphatase family protein [Zongyangia hominis]
MTKVYLIRHGEALGNVTHVFQGLSDLPLTDNGRKQAKLVGERMKAVHLDKVYASHMTRAQDTAQAVASCQGLPVITEPGVVEINGGEWEGQYWPDMPKKYPRETYLWDHNIYKLCIPGGEPIQHVCERMRDTVRKLAKENEGKTIAVVSHGGAIRCLMQSAMHLEPDEMDKLPWCDNTSVTLVEYDDNFDTHVVFYNDASHLDVDGVEVNDDKAWQMESLEEKRA